MTVMSHVTAVVVTLLCYIESSGIAACGHCTIKPVMQSKQGMQSKQIMQSKQGMQRNLCTLLRSSNVIHS